MTWRMKRSTSLQNFIVLRHPMPEISVTKIPADKQTSTPVVRTGVYPHMPIDVTTVVKDTFGSVFSKTRYKILCMYSCRIFYHISRHRLRHWPSSRNTNSLQHWSSTTMRRLVSHSTHVSRRSSKLVTPGSRASNVLSIFRFLTLGACPWVKGHQRGR